MPGSTAAALVFFGICSKNSSDFYRHTFGISFVCMEQIGVKVLKITISFLLLVLLYELFLWNKEMSNSVEKHFNA